MLVKATDMSSRLKVRIKELHRIANAGEVFDVTPMRFDVLSGMNRYNVAFVVREEVKKEIAVKEPIKEEKVEEVVTEEAPISDHDNDNTEVVEETPKPKTKKRSRKKKDK